MQLLKSQASRIDCKYKSYSYTTELGLQESTMIPYKNEV